MRQRRVDGMNNDGMAGGTRLFRKATAALILLLTLSALMVSCTVGETETGVLQGHVTIGPLEPVQSEGEPELTPAPEVYAARKIIVYAEDGRTEVARLEIDANGNYSAVLPVGTYWVDINHVGIDAAEGLPKRITIEAGQVVRLDIDIDTGIR